MRVPRAGRFRSGRERGLQFPIVIRPVWISQYLVQAEVFRERPNGVVFQSMTDNGADRRWPMVGTAKNKDFDCCQISTNIAARVWKEGKGKRRRSVVVRLQIRVHLLNRGIGVSFQQRVYKSYRGVVFGGERVSDDRWWAKNIRGMDGSEGTCARIKRGSAKRIVDVFFW